MVFTSGGTEADNLAVKGIHWARLAEDPRRTRILASAIEHHAVLDPLDWLRDSEGVEVELLPVDDKGRLDVDALREAVERDPDSVSLISVMSANNEVGTLQPVEEVVAVAAAHAIPVHTDAIQAVGAVPVDFAASGVDALSLTGHKLGGPFGVGALIVRREVVVTPLVHGGGQERDIRSGTIDTPAIAGFAAAVELAVKEQAGAREPGRGAARRPGPPGHRGGARRARPRGRHRPARDAPAARQRPPGLPRLRGRLAADAPRRPRASSAPPGRPARPAYLSPHTSCSRWAVA